MSDEKKSVSEDSNMTDYANLAFNPYATSTDDLTFSTFGNGESIKNGKSMENGSFEPEHFVEKNPHYEDTAEVIEKAGLGSTGRRKKENIVYEAAGLKKKPKTEKRPEPPQLRASNIPPRPAEDWSGISKNKNNTRWKLPFLILCILILISLIGAAFGVMAYLRDGTCSCSSNLKAHTEPLKASQIAELKDSLKMISTELEMMKAMFHVLERTQTMQKDELTQTNASVNLVHRQLNSAIQMVDSTFSIKLQNVNNSISSLSGDVDKVNSTVAEVTNANQQLNNTLNSINSKFSVQLKNISKQIGPRGFNGSQGLQGPQGPQGIGNISACIQHYDTGIGPISSSETVSVSYKQRTGWKVMSAVCTTERNKGAVQTVLSVDNDTYTCTCVDPSTTPPFTAALESGSSNKYIVACKIIYWECPILT